MEMVKNQHDWDALPNHLISSITIDSDPNHPVQITTGFSGRSISIKNNSKVLIHSRTKFNANQYLKALSDYYYSFVISSLDETYRNEIKAYDEACCVVHGNTSIIANDSSRIFACDDSLVVAYDQAFVEANDKSTIRAHDKSSIKAYGSSTVEAVQYIIDQVGVGVYSAAVKLTALNNTKVHRRYYAPINKFLLF